MNDSHNKGGVVTADRNGSVKVELLPNGKGSDGMIRTKDLDIAKLVTNEQRIEAPKFLEGKETQIENRYRGLRRYLRRVEITRMIAMLSLYRYLDQLDIHQKHRPRHKQLRPHR